MLLTRIKVFEFLRNKNKWIELTFFDVFVGELLFVDVKIYSVIIEGHVRKLQNLDIKYCHQCIIKHLRGALKSIGQNNDSN